MDSKSHAIAIVTKLVDAGYTAYFAGGWVRDFILGHPSDDIDIATDAPPEKIMDLFPGTILVGLAFGVVIVVIEGHQFEVATFRRDIDYHDGRRPDHIELSTPQEDAFRRDFTINGMFYDPLEGIIHDFVHGYEDLKMGILRTIGDPHQRFGEDRLRIIRAIRFAARFGFAIEQETQQAIIENADRLFPAVAMERVWQEFTKMAAYPHFDWALVEMHRLGLLAVIFPELKNVHLKDIRHHVDVFHYFPQGTPVILYLMELFYNQTTDEKIEICKRLRISTHDCQLAEYCDTVSKQLSNGLIKENVEWAHFYAHPQTQLCLDILAARLPKDEQAKFLQEHANRAKNLKTHIERIQKKSPLISSTLLMQNGIVPGKIMGSLLKEAEKIAINSNESDPQNILNQLKHSPLWTK